MKTTFNQTTRFTFSLMVFLCLFSVLSIAQNEKMVVEGAIVIDNNDDANPVPGTIRWTGTDFEGYDGTAWLSLTCCNASTPDSTVVTDQDGNDIPVAFIGTQCWMTENLRVTTYNDGTPIPFISNGQAWQANNANNPIPPAYCWPLDDPTLAVPHGALYNWYAVDAASNGGKNICPAGWHIPTDADVATLLQFLDPNAFPTQSQIAGGLLKATGTTATGGLWAAPNTGATDAYGFNGVPSIRRGGGNFVSGLPEFELIFWTTDTVIPTTAHAVNMEHDSAMAAVGNYSSIFGLSCRCVKD